MKTMMSFVNITLGNHRQSALHIAYVEFAMLIYIVLAICFEI